MKRPPLLCTQLLRSHQQDQVREVLQVTSVVKQVAYLGQKRVMLFAKIEGVRYDPIGEMDSTYPRKHALEQNNDFISRTLSTCRQRTIWIQTLYTPKAEEYRVHFRLSPELQKTSKSDGGCVFEEDICFEGLPTTSLSQKGL